MSGSVQTERVSGRAQIEIRKINRDELDRWNANLACGPFTLINLDAVRMAFT
jgi:hypothetical protein